jgi:putative peptidoglycan lipid II flippase
MTHARVRRVSTRKRLVTATGGMAAVTIVSRLSGYLRDKVIAVLLGAGAVSDAFYAGLAVPSMFRAFLAEGALHAAFIPSLAELKERSSVDDQRRFVSAMTAVLLLVLPVVVAFGIVAAPLLVRVFAVGFVERPATYRLAVLLTRMMFPYLGLISLAALAQGVLNASDRFALPAATPIALNVCIVAGTVTAVEFAHGTWSWLAIGVIAGGLAQFAVQWWACLRVGIPLVPGGGAFRHPEVRRVLALMIPGVPALGIYQVTLLLSYRFASSVGAGAVVWRFNAARLNELVYGVIIVQLTTAVLPMLAAERAQDEAGARHTLGFAMRLVTLVALPAAVFLTVAARPLTGALFGGGRYTTADVVATASALAMYGWGIPFLGLTKLLAGASYAWKDTRIPVVAAGVNLVVFWVFGVWWTPLMGVAGVAAAASAGQAANVTLLLALSGLKRRLPSVAEVVPGIARHALAAGLTGVALALVVAWLPVPARTGVRSVALVAGLVASAAVLYTLLLILLGAPEWRELRAFLARRKSS